MLRLLPRWTDPPNPNDGSRRVRHGEPVNGQLVFDAASWTEAVASDASWAEASWSEASWAEASWSEASWTEASWYEASWAEASWADASWTEATASEATDARVGNAGPAAQAAGVPRSGDSSRRPALSPNGGCRAPTRRRTLRRRPCSRFLRTSVTGRREENGKAAMRVSLRSRVGSGDHRAPEEVLFSTTRHPARHDARAARRREPVADRARLHGARVRRARRRSRCRSSTGCPDTTNWFGVRRPRVRAAAIAQLFMVRTPRNQSYHTTIVFLVPAALILPPQQLAAARARRAHPGVAEVPLPLAACRRSTSRTSRSRSWRRGGRPS